MAAKTPISSGLSQASFRNFVINGAMDFWQRGITASGINFSSRLADRLLTANSTAAINFTASRSTNVPTVAQAGYQGTYSLRYECTAGGSVAASDLTQIQYAVEGYDYAELHGRPARIQFWVRSNLPGIYTFKMRNNAGDRVYYHKYTIAAANTWQLVSIDLSMDTTGTWLFDNSTGLRCFFILSAGSSGATYSGALNTWQATNVAALTTQVNLGATTGNYWEMTQFQILDADASSFGAIPFARAGRTIQEELAMCQRYYEKSYQLADVPGTNTSSGILIYNSGTNNTSAILESQVYFATRKRATPTMTTYDRVGGGSAISIVSAGGTITNAIAGLINSIGEGSFSVRENSPGSNGSRAGLAVHWVADADI